MVVVDEFGQRSRVRLGKQPRQLTLRVLPFPANGYIDCLALPAGVTLDVEF